MAEVDFVFVDDAHPHYRLDRLTDGRIACCICFEFRTRDELEPAGDGTV